MIAAVVLWRPAFGHALIPAGYYQENGAIFSLAGEIKLTRGFAPAGCECHAGTVPIRHGRRAAMADAALSYSSGVPKET